ncbi:hypothetical protein Lesp02_70230 [Lentzea sp. NBRC 105346]|uniref:helix-turn-helix domain-containing protein n=1 Tax=Lentzea sp. NBRC 105346 TaxID=3032205 RepID=UPI0024A30D0B|nr:helix-turn-helix transcriptional regulator [Lentzea sp. NBRC 105346]GLZ34836.1 hypothetical protein Lesp02_70230 [Lentzea sp. NBRC 105346]
MQPTTSPARPKPVRIRRDVLTEHRTAAGINSDAELAKRMGVAPSTVHRVLTHQVEPSARFIKGVLDVLTDASFADLFGDEPETSSS